LLVRRSLSEVGNPDFLETIPHSAFGALPQPLRRVITAFLTNIGDLAFHHLNYTTSRLNREVEK